jgi:Uma2 family endonuclease
MALRENLYTFEEFWEIAHLPENADRRLELEDGVIVDMGSSSKLNTVVSGRLIHYLNAHVIANDLGIITVPDAGYKLGGSTYRQPEVAFISKQRSNDLKGVYFTVAPDLAIEVVSPDEDVFKKANEYIEAGTRMVWAVYAIEKRVYVFRPNPDGTLNVQPYGIEDTLDGGNVLPNFSLRVRDIFPA